MEIFNKKSKKDIVTASAPEETETPEEVKYVEELSSPEVIKQRDVATPVIKEEETYREVPVCMSQAQINNLVIENNIMLKQIVSEMD